MSADCNDRPVPTKTIRDGPKPTVRCMERETRSNVAVAEPGTTRALIWRLQSGGWTQLEAGNLAAIALGLWPARTGWTGAELDHLRFLKSLVTTGRVEH